MPRRKRQNPLLSVARNYLIRNAPELKDAKLRMHMLDGPPDSPRYAITVEMCGPEPCPHGVARQIADAGACTVRDCPLRTSIRLLLSGTGEVVQFTRSGLHWV